MECHGPALNATEVDHQEVRYFLCFPHCISMGSLCLYCSWLLNFIVDNKILESVFDVRTTKYLLFLPTDGVAVLAFMD